MAVAITAEALVAILVSGNSDVVLGDAVGFFNGAQLGVNQKAELVGRGFVNQDVADRAVIGLGVVGLNPEFDPCQCVSAVFAEVKIPGIFFNFFDHRFEIGFFFI